MFGNLIKQARLAARASLTREYVSLLERNKRSPTIEVFIRLVRAVGLSPDQVILVIEKTLAE